LAPLFGGDAIYMLISPEKALYPSRFDAIFVRAHPVR
jgi:hypothetical protein